MTTATEVTRVSPLIDEADRVLRENGPETWPKGREAQSCIRWAYDSLTEALDIHMRLCNGSLSWEALYDPDAGLWEGSEEATVDAVEANARDAAAALVKLIGEYGRCENGTGEGERT
jgi:hypothetical protein